MIKLLEPNSQKFKTIGTSYYCLMLDSDGVYQSDAEYLVWTSRERVQSVDYTHPRRLVSMIESNLMCLALNQNSVSRSGDKEYYDHEDSCEYGVFSSRKTWNDNEHAYFTASGIREVRKFGAYVIKNWMKRAASEDRLRYPYYDELTLLIDKFNRRNE